jgi:hypothetical protein
MRFFNHVRLAACAILLALAVCASGTAIAATNGTTNGTTIAAANGTTNSCFFCNAPVRHVHGYYSSRGPMPRETTFVHKGETVYVDGPASVIAYDGIVIAYAEARVHGFDNATIYYYQRALVSAYGKNVRLFFCSGSQNVRFDPGRCYRVQRP